MATLQAVVDIQDRASSKFDRLTRSANMFKGALMDLDRKLGEVERKIQRITRESISIKVDLDMTKFEAQLAEMKAMMVAAGMGGVDSGGFAMPRGGVSDNMDADIVGKIRRAAPDNNPFKNVGLQKADNGALGFLSVAGKLALNFTKIVSAMAEPIKDVLIEGLMNGSKMLSMFGRTAAMGAEQATALAGSIAPVIAGLAAAALGAGVFVMIGTALAGVIALISAALTSLLVPLAGVIVGLGAIGGVIAFAILPMVKWVTETKKLVDEKDQLNQRLKYLTKGSKEYNDTLKKRDELQNKLNKSGAEGIFSKMKDVWQGLKDVIFTEENKKTWVDTLNAGIESLQPLLPIISEMASKFSDVVKGIAERFREFTSSKEGQELIRNFFLAALPLVDKFASVLGALGRIFLAIGVAAGPITDKLLGDFAGWLDKIATYLSSPDGLKSMQGFFETMYPVFKGLMELIGAFIGGIKDIGVASAPEIMAVMGWLREVGGQFVKWVIETVKKYGPDFAKWLKLIGNVIGVLWDMATKLYDAFQPIIDVIVDIFTNTITWIRIGLRLIEILHIVDIVKIGFILLLTPIRLVNAILSKLFGWLQDFASWVAESTFGQALASAFQVVADVLKDVVGYLSTIWDWITKLADIPILGDIIDSFAGNGGNGGGSGNLPANMRGGGMDAVTGNKRPGNKKTGHGASGAIVTKPTRALIGEAGPEAVVPLSATSGSRRLQLGPGSGTQISGDIHIHGVENLDQFVKEINKHIANIPRQSGTDMSIG